MTLTEHSYLSHLELLKRCYVGNTPCLYSRKRVCGICVGYNAFLLRCGLITATICAKEDKGNGLFKGIFICCMEITKLIQCRRAMCIARCSKLEPLYHVTVNCLYPVAINFLSILAGQ